MSVEVMQALLCFQSVLFIVSILLLIRAQGQALSVCKEIRALLLESRMSNDSCISNAMVDATEGGTANLIKHSGPVGSDLG